MDAADLVSVIIPTYNREKYISDSIISILNQTYSNLECIVVDDGSTDKTKDIVRQIEDTRLVYYSLNCNMGQAAARNKGIELARGKYIAFNDSDDVWEKEKLQLQMQLMKEERNLSMVYCRYALYEKNTLIHQYPDDVTVRKLIDEKCNLLELLLINNFIGTPTIVVKKNVFEQLGGFNETLKANEDYELVLRIVQKFKIGFVNRFLVKAFRYDVSVSKKSVNVIDSLLYIFNQYQIKNKSVWENNLFVLIAQLEDEKIVENLKKRISSNQKISKEELTDAIITEKRSGFLINKYAMLSVYRNNILFHLEENGIENVKRYMERNKINNLAVYGAGRMGQIIFSRLYAQLDVDIILIDKNKKGHGIVNIENIPEKIELVISSIHESLYSRDEIMKYSNAEIKNIQELLLEES